MAWVWTTVGVASLALAAFCFVAAATVYVSHARRLQNRLLALLLFGWGGGWLMGGALMYMTDDPLDAWAWQVAAFAAVLPIPWLYVAFLSTLATPLARPVARARPVLYAGAALAAAWVVADPMAFVPAVVPGTMSPWNAEVGSALIVAFGGPNILVGVLGLVFAVSALWRAPPGSLDRAQAAAYLAAFAVYDANNLSFVLLPTTGAFPDLLVYTNLGLTFAFVLLLSYGVLKAQLFDIDLRIKWGVSRGTVAAAIAGAFVVVSELVDRLLAIDGTLPGVAAAVALAFAFRPLERWASRLADRVMPGVQDTKEYADARKRAVYRSALDELRAAGPLSEADRAFLDGMRERLGIPPEGAPASERSAPEAG